MNTTITRSIDPDLTISHLTRSILLPRYLRAVIIDETLATWQQSLANQALAVDLDSSPQIDNSTNSGDARTNLLQQYKRAEWGHLIGSRFLQRKSQLDRVLFSVIQVANLNMAQELYFRIHEQGQSFTHLATEYSEHPTAHRGGCVGPISGTELHPLIYHQTIGLKPKQLSPIFELNERYTFLRLDRWLPAQFDLAMEERFLDELFEQWLQQQIEARIGKIDIVSFDRVLGDREIESRN
jgi:PPIC-type PPIASE domain